MANLITLGRLGLLLITVALLYSGSVILTGIAVFGTLVVVAGDMFDGWIARHRGEVNHFGAILDISADRAVEAIYLVAFANLDIIPLWPVVLILLRGFLVNAVHAAAASEGKTAFGPKTHLESRWSRVLSASRLSRALYGSVKAATFSYLSLLVLLRPIASSSSGVIANNWQLFAAIGLGLTLLLTTFCLARGFAVLYEGRHRFWPSLR